MVVPVGRDPFAPPLIPPKAPPIIRHTVNTPAERVVDPFVRAKTPTAVSSASVNRAVGGSPFSLITALDVSAVQNTLSDSYSAFLSLAVVPLGTLSWALLLISLNIDTGDFCLASSHLEADPSTLVVSQKSLTQLESTVLSDFTAAYGGAIFPASPLVLTYDNTLWFNAYTSSSWYVCALSLNDDCTSVAEGWTTGGAHAPSLFPLSLHNMLKIDSSDLSNVDITTNTSYTYSGTNPYSGSSVFTCIGTDSVVYGEYVISAQTGEAPAVSSLSGGLFETGSGFFVSDYYGLTLGPGGFSSEDLYSFEYSDGVVSAYSTSDPLDSYGQSLNYVYLNYGIGAEDYGNNFFICSYIASPYLYVYSGEFMEKYSISSDGTLEDLGPALLNPNLAFNCALVEFSSRPTLAQWASGDLPSAPVPSAVDFDASFGLNFGSVDNAGNVLFVGGASNDTFSGLAAWSGAANAGGVARSIGLASVASGSRVKQSSKKTHTPDPPTPAGVNRSSDPFLYPVT